MHYEYKLILKDVLKRIDYLGIQFNIYYTPKYSLNPIVPDTFFPDVFYYVFNHTTNLISPDLFSGYVFHIWNDLCENMPNDLENKFFSINYKLKIVNVNLSVIDKKDIYFELKDRISKIIGYMFLETLSFNDNKSYMKYLWKKYRGYICNTSDSERELFAEDFKIFFGQSRGVYSLTNFSNCFNVQNFTIGKNVKGLRDLIFIWKYVDFYLNKNFFKDKEIIIQKNELFSDSDFFYFGIFFHIYKFRQGIKTYKLDRNGHFIFDINTSKWKTLYSI